MVTRISDFRVREDGYLECTLLTPFRRVLICSVKGMIDLIKKEEKHARKS